MHLFVSEGKGGLGSSVFVKPSSVLFHNLVLLINRARGPYWENIARGLSGRTGRSEPYEKE